MLVRIATGGLSHPQKNIRIGATTYSAAPPRTILSMFNLPFFLNIIQLPPSEPTPLCSLLQSSEFFYPS